MGSLTREQALNFINKLSGKTVERGATLEEASAAAAKIQQLCQEYNVSMDEAIKRGEEVNDPVGSLALLTYGYGPYETLINVLCHYNFCRSARMVGKARQVVVGTDFNQKIVEYLYHSLRQQLSRLYKRDFKSFEELHGKLNRSQKMKFSIGWWNGAINAIILRLQKQQEIFETQHTALVISSKSLVDEAYAKMFPNAKPAASRKQTMFVDANEMGKLAGQTVQMNKGVGGSGAPKQIEGGE